MAVFRPPLAIVFVQDDLKTFLEVSAGLILRFLLCRFFGVFCVGFSRWSLLQVLVCLGVFRSLLCMHRSLLFIRRSLVEVSFVHT